MLSVLRYLKKVLRKRCQLDKLQKVINKMLSIKKYISKIYKKNAVSLKNVPKHFKKNDFTTQITYKTHRTND